MALHSNATKISPFASEGLMAMFYLVQPSKSSFPDVTKVPNYVTSATAHFFILIVLENIILFIKGNRKLRANDKLTSLSAGMYSEIIRLVGLKSVGVYLYIYVYENFHLYELPWDSTTTWIIMALLVDFLYYWFHRAAHEVNFLWSSHSTHHSSEDYNLTTALRQSVLQTFASMFFFLPAALFVPPSVFLVHSQFNLLYQFWIHTELINNLGPLEYILNTPSHHRVHHGRNRYCIDKNYAGTLIIWDRMFEFNRVGGTCSKWKAYLNDWLMCACSCNITPTDQPIPDSTFEAEKKDEKVAYGIISRLNSFEPNYAQFSYFRYVLKKSYRAKGFWNKILTLMNGPGWSPGTPRLGDLKDIPEIESPIHKYDPEISAWMNAYVIFHWFVVLLVYNASLVHHAEMPRAIAFVCLMYILVGLTCFGKLFDNTKYATTLEFLRCVASAGLFYYKPDLIDELLHFEPKTSFALAVIYQTSAILWSVRMFKRDTKQKVK